MDVDFVVHDTYSGIRPQWKLATDLQEAASLFSEAVAQNYKPQDSEKLAEPEEDDAESSSSDEGLEEDAIPEAEEEQESSEEAEVSLLHIHGTYLIISRLRMPNKTTKANQKTNRSTLRARKRNVIRKQRPSLTASSRR